MKIIIALFLTISFASADFLFGNNQSLPSLKDMGLLKADAKQEIQTQSIFKLSEPLEAKIIAISPDKKSAVVNSSGLKKGLSGLVWQQLDDTHRILVARTYVSGIKGNKAKINFTVLADTAEEALPKILNRPKIGDMATFYLLEDRGMIIAPNQTDYNQVLQIMPQNIKLVHPDLFATFLTTIRDAKPNSEQLIAFCANLQLSNVYFVLSDGIYKTDCFTMAIMDKVEFSGSKENAQLPFYNRIGEIPTGYFGTFKKDITNYESYYKTLLGLK